MVSVKSSKNVVTGDPNTGGGDFRVGDTITYNLKEAAEYRSLSNDEVELNRRIEKTRMRILKYPEDSDYREELVELETKRNQKLNEIKILEGEVYKIAIELSKLKLNSERARLAKDFFQTGKYQEARAVLDKVEMHNELEAILQDEQLGEALIRKAQTDREDIANEFLMRARLDTFDFTISNRIERVVDSYETSLKAQRNIDNLSAYAVFLLGQNQFSQALPLYDEVLKILYKIGHNEPEIYLSQLADSLNNFGHLLQSKNDTTAIDYFKAAYDIRIRQFEGDPEKFIAEKAHATANLAYMYWRTGQPARVVLALYESAIADYRRLIEEAPEVDHVVSLARALNNAGVYYRELKKYDEALPLYLEALKIRKNLFEQVSPMYLPDLAETRNNVGVVYSLTDKFEEANLIFEETMRAWDALCEDNPQAYLPRKAKTLEALGDNMRAAGDPNNAIRKYRQSIETLTEISRVEPEAYHPDLTRVKSKNLALNGSAKR